MTTDHDPDTIKAVQAHMRVPEDQAIAMLDDCLNQQEVEMLTGDRVERGGDLVRVAPKREQEER